MAGPGGGPPRRSHTKSRKGCETCKKRHIRCDEVFPQCRNCTKHSVRCPYMDMPAPEERAQSPDRPDLLWTPDIEAQILLWQQTGEFPFPSLNIFPAPPPQYFPVEDLRLIYHVASISMDLNIQDSGNFTIWTNQIPLFIKIGVVNSFVMSALLALSASHIAWLTDCPMVKQIAQHHHSKALGGLHEAVGTFSKETSDAVLAASLLLSWQASEWRGWTQLMHGTSTVIDAMQPWKVESHFESFMSEQATFPTAPPSPLPNTKGPLHFRQVDLDALEHAFRQLERVERVLIKAHEDTKAITELMNFVRRISKASPLQTPAQRFEMLTPLRAWLFWLPIMYLQQARDNPYALVVLAYYYTVALVVEPLFPEVGAAYFGSLSLQPIEGIARRLFSFNVSQPASHLQTPLGLIEYPIDMVAMFRRRLGWKQPHRGVSFPTFQSGSSVANVLSSHTMSDIPMASFGNTLAYNCGPEHLSYFSSQPQATANTMALSPFPAQVQYLHVPTIPSFVNEFSAGGMQNMAYQSSAYTESQFHSPMSSYEEATRNAQGVDDYMYQVKYEPQTFPTASFAGFVQPTTIWI